MGRQVQGQLSGKYLTSQAYVSTPGLGRAERPGLHGQPSGCIGEQYVVRLGRSYRWRRGLDAQRGVKCRNSAPRPSRSPVSSRTGRSTSSSPPSPRPGSGPIAHIHTAGDEAFYISDGELEFLNGDEAGPPVEAVRRRGPGGHRLEHREEDLRRPPRGFRRGHPVRRRRGLRTPEAIAATIEWSGRGREGLHDLTTAPTARVDGAVAGRCGSAPAVPAAVTPARAAGPGTTAAGGAPSRPPRVVWWPRRAPRATRTAPGGGRRPWPGCRTG